MAPIPTPPLKTHGGKNAFHGKAARWIVSLMARHVHYVEPFSGGLAVLFARDPDDERLWLPPHKGASEVANDLDGRLMNFWRAIADRPPGSFDRFVRVAEATPFSRAAWEEAHRRAPTGDPVEDALAFFIDCRMSLAGRRKGFTLLTRSRTRRRMNGNASEWVGAVSELPAVHERLWGRGVVLESMPALDLIRSHDGPGTLFYCDPPYLHESRSTTDEYGPFEMTEAQHLELLAGLRRCRGKVMLSGYPSTLYERELAGWTRHTLDLPNNAAGGRTKALKTEVLWCNY